MVLYSSDNCIFCMLLDSTSINGTYNTKLGQFPCVCGCDVHWYSIIDVREASPKRQELPHFSEMVFKITFIILLVVNLHSIDDLFLWRIYASPDPNDKSVHWSIYASLGLYDGRTITVLAWRCIDVSKPNFFIIYSLFMYADSEGCNALHCYR